jgi:hypothetical protein
VRWFALVMLIGATAAVLGCKGSSSQGSSSQGSSSQGSSSNAPALLDAPAIAIDAAVADATVADAAVIDAAVVIDAAIDAMPIDAGRPARRKPRAKSSLIKCLEECRRKNRSMHCMDDEGLSDCPCDCK